jgi:hypothetical protein
MSSQSKAGLVYAGLANTTWQDYELGNQSSRLVVLQVGGALKEGTVGLICLRFESLLDN